MDDIIKDEVLGELEYQEVAWVGGNTKRSHYGISLFVETVVLDTLSVAVGIKKMVLQFFCQNLSHV